MSPVPNTVIPVAERPKPIRFDVDTWLIMRNDLILPKAVVQRIQHADGDRYMLFKWDLDAQRRQLMNILDSLERADDLVRYDLPQPDGAHRGRPNGR